MQVIDWLLTLPSFALEIKKGFIFAYRGRKYRIIAHMTLMYIARLKESLKILSRYRIQDWFQNCFKTKLRIEIRIV